MSVFVTHILCTSASLEMASISDFNLKWQVLVYIMVTNRHVGKHTLQGYSIKWVESQVILLFSLLFLHPSLLPNFCHPQWVWWVITPSGHPPSRHWRKDPHALSHVRWECEHASGVPVCVCHGCLLLVTSLGDVGSMAGGLHKLSDWERSHSAGLWLRPLPPAVCNCCWASQKWEYFSLVLAQLFKDRKGREEEWVMASTGMNDRGF